MIEQKNFFTSWSGGKDSALAHYKAVQEGGKPVCLLSMFEENEEYSRSHALPYGVILAQADAMGIPLLVRGASWQTYESQFLDVLDVMKRNGITHGVFGDIDLEDHLVWVEQNCARKDIEAYHPLRYKERRKVLDELLEAGFEAVIVVVDEEKLPSSFLGKEMNEETIQEIEKLGVDPCGEEGEFHTLIVDGPMFNKRIPVDFKEIEHHDHYAFLPVKLQVG